MAIWRPTDDTPLIPLRTPFGLMADSIDAALADTGWVDFGGGFTPAANWTVITAQYRKVGWFVTVNIQLTYVGPTVTASTTQGNFTDIPMGNIIPDTLQPFNGFAAPISLAQMGVTEWFGRVDGAGGGVVMSHGLPGMTLTNPTNIWVRGGYVAGP